MWQSNLIHLFTFYLAATFLISTFRRVRQYHDVAQMAVNFPNRWPKVLKQIKQYKMIFFTWATFRPLLLAIGLMLVQFICSRLIWPQAKITPADLLSEWWMLPFIGLIGFGMVAVDAYGLIYVGQLDRKENEKYLDEAEHWMTSWKAPLISTITLSSTTRSALNPASILAQELKAHCVP